MSKEKITQKPTQKPVSQVDRPQSVYIQNSDHSIGNIEKKKRNN